MDGKVDFACCDMLGRAPGGIVPAAPILKFPAVLLIAASFLARARAAARPSRVRLAIISRSCSATAAST
jgi:hypothetical protein